MDLMPGEKRVVEAGRGNFFLVNHDSDPPKPAVGGLRGALEVGLLAGPLFSTKEGP